MAVAARRLQRGSLTYRDLWRTPEDGNRLAAVWAGKK